MYSLRTFGTLTLTQNGSIVEPLGTQRKALAVLTVLATDGTVSRDRLMALLWPESDTERARGSLRQTIHSLRQLLQTPDLILGRAELTLNPADLDSDVQRFRDALDRGDPQGAVALYQGTFLDGIHLNGSAEMEQWVEARRGTLASLYRDGLESLAREAGTRGDHAEAARWWTRRTTEDPLDGKAALHLMQALVAAGQPTAALQHFLAHELVLRRELGVTPDPDVIALAERLRSDAGRVKAGERPPRDITMPVRDSRPAPTGSVEPVALAPAKPTRGVPRTLIFAGLLGVALLIGGLLLKRGEPSSAQDQGPSAEVVALYETGVHQYDRRIDPGITEAIAAFSAAIARDSTYSSAWSGLAKAYYRAYQRRITLPGMSGDSVLRLAVRAADRALATDSNNADAWLARAQVSRGIDPTDVAPAIRAAQRALLLDSTSAPIWHELAAAAVDQADLVSAVKYWRRSVALDPRYTQALSYLGMTNYWLGNLDSAAVWADSAVAVDPTFVFARTTTARVAIGQGDFVRAVAGFEAALRLATDIEALNARLGVALVHAEAGNRAAALAELRETEDTVRGFASLPLHTAVYRAQVYAALGDAREAVRWLQRYKVRRDLHFQLHLRCDPSLDPLALDSAFRALLVAPRC
jgi:DNA-binding SARP family transcriptional activator/Tfp pilus assembly protein PilF